MIVIGVGCGMFQHITPPCPRTLAFLEEGDTMILRGHCERPGARRIGFGECRGTVLPALPMA